MKIERGVIENPFFIILYGAAGVGKSSFCSYAPSPIYLDVENGTKKLDVDRVSDIKTLEDFYALLAPENYIDYKTIVIDTIDYLEQLIFEYICRKTGKKSISDFGYGKGFELSLEIWISILNKLSDLRKLEDGKNIILIAHDQIKKFENPLSDSYDRYNLKLNQKAASYIVANVDAVFFISKSFHLSEDTKDKTRKIAKSAPGRVIHTEETPSIIAKNRYKLEPEIKIQNKIEDYQSFFKSLK